MSSADSDQEKEGYEVATGNLTIKGRFTPTQMDTVEALVKEATNPTRLLTHKSGGKIKALFATPEQRRLLDATEGETAWDGWQLAHRPAPISARGATVQAHRPALKTKSAAFDRSSAMVKSLAESMNASLWQWAEDNPEFLNKPSTGAVPLHNEERQSREFRGAGLIFKGEFLSDEVGKLRQLVLDWSENCSLDDALAQYRHIKAGSHSIESANFSATQCSIMDWFVTERGWDDVSDQQVESVGTNSNHHSGAISREALRSKRSKHNDSIYRVRQ